MAQEMEWFFGGWSGLIRVVLFAILGYLAFAFLIRISGKRTISRMNTFDLIVSVAVGALLARTILANDTALLEGIAAIAALILMQILFTWLPVRSRRARGLVQATPVILFYHGRFITELMDQQRVVKEDILEAVRSTGLDSMEPVEAVVLEADGNLSVIRKSSTASKDALAPVVRTERDDLRRSQ